MNIIQKFRVSFYSFILGLFKNSFWKIKPSFSKSDIGKEGQDKTTVIFYNLCSVDSVISAALLYSKLVRDAEGSALNIIAVAASNRMPVIFQKKCAVYCWVGVVPSNEILNYLASQTISVSHYVYAPNKDKVKYPYINRQKVTWLDGIDNVSAAYRQTEDCVGGLSFYKDMIESPAYKTVMFQVSACEDIEINFYLSKLIHDFDTNNMLALKDQAFIFKLYSAALETLTRRAIFSTENTVEEKDIADYKTAALLAKDSLSRLFEYTNFKLNGEYQRVPLINIGQLHQPLAARILMQSYNFFVFYEQQGMQTVYTPYSRIAGFDKYVIDNISSGKNGRLSSEM